MAVNKKISEMTTYPSVIAGTEVFPLVTGSANYKQETYPFFRTNLLLNPNFHLWQRGTSFTGTAGGLYTADRWFAIRQGTTGYTVSRQTGSVGTDPNFYYLRLQRDNGNASTEEVRVGQSLENIDCTLLPGQPLSLSFYAKKGANFSPTGGYLKAYVTTSTGTNEKYNSLTGALNAYGEPALTTSWVRYTVLIGVVPSTKTQAHVWFSFTPVGTAGAADYVDIANVQLEVGNVVTPFEQLGYAEELRRCERYYQTSFPLGATPAAGYGQVANYPLVCFAAGDTRAHVSHRGGVMRLATPTLTVYRTSDVGGAGAGNIYVPGTGWVNGTVTLSFQDDRTFIISIAAAGPVTPSAYLGGFYYTLSAEL